MGDPKAAPIDTTYGNIANMIISLPPRAAAGTGNQQKYKDGMPFGTRGGMIVEHMFPGRRRVRADHRRHGPGP